jgi:hypothetical protein
MGVEEGDGGRRSSDRPNGNLGLGMSEMWDGCVHRKDVSLKMLSATCISLLRSGIVITQPYFAVATCLIWLIATVNMHYSSDRRL